MDMSDEFVQGQRGSSLDVEGELAWGFFGQYNFNEHFALAGEFAWSDPDYLATFPLDPIPGQGLPPNTVVTVDAELDVWFTNFKAVYQPHRSSVHAVRRGRVRLDVRRFEHPRRPGGYGLLVGSVVGLHVRVVLRHVLEHASRRCRTALAFAGT